MRLSRSDRSLVSEWWFTLDRVLAACILTLMGTGVILSLAAGPAMAARHGFAPFHYVFRHALFTGIGLALAFWVSLASPRQVRRLALGLFLATLVLLVLVLLVGPELNGAQRWLRIAGYSLQPSEFAKPAFVVLAAWLFAEARRRPDLPAIPMAIAVYILLAGLIVVEPDIGQTLLISLVWVGLFFVSGMPLAWLAASIGIGLGGLAVAYAVLPHVQSRLDRFFDPSSGDSYQMDRARRFFMEGGFFGRGPGEGAIKSQLPDSHTDFIFAVIAEEYGIIACLVLIGLFGLIVVRSLSHAWREPDGFVRNGIVGLTLLFALQAIINMAVNVGLLPAKGMTLPFISYGGSSLLAMSLAMGMLLALTRRRPGARMMTSGAGPRGLSRRAGVPSAEAPAEQARS